MTPADQVPSGVALLLARLGADVASGFAALLAPLDLTPSHVALLRTVALAPGLSQQALAARLGIVASRVVRLLDELEERGLVERRRSATDRRHHEVHLAAGARDRLAEVRRVVAEHDAALVAPLGPDEVATLVGLLERLAEGLRTR